MTFDVVGGDDRVGDLQLRVVDRPELVGMELECVYPEYLDRPPRGCRSPAACGSPKARSSAPRHLDQAAHRRPRAKHARPEATFALRRAAEPVKKIRLGIRHAHGRRRADDPRHRYRRRRRAASRIACRSPSCGTSCRRSPCGSPASARRSRPMPSCRSWVKSPTTTASTRLVRLPGRRRRRPRAAARATSRTANRTQLELDAFDTAAPDEARRQRHRTEAGADAVSLNAGARTATTSPRAARRHSQQFALDVVTVPQLLALLERRELELRQRFEAIYRQNDRHAQPAEPRRFRRQPKRPDPSETDAGRTAAAEPRPAALWPARCRTSPSRPTRCSASPRRSTTSTSSSRTIASTTSI